jgi:hypothetical protein
LGKHPKECKSTHNRGPYTPMFIAALFIIAKLWNQPRCPATTEWLTKMWYMHNGVLFSIKNNDIMLVTGKWVELEIVMLNEINQAQKDKFIHRQSLDLKKL